MGETLSFWVIFNACVLALLGGDLLFSRRNPEQSLRSAARWWAFWVLLAVGFGLFVWRALGASKAAEFFTGYVIEYSLSVDNLFVFILVFRAFAVPLQSQHRCLVWGILGALVMRGLMIGAGTALILHFHWVLYIFGAFLLGAGGHMLLSRGSRADPAQNSLVRFARRVLPVSPDHDGTHFLTRRAEGGLALTPLALALLAIEMMDLVFALDSIPAVFAITRDPLIVYTSNVCAILGLRSIYFLVAGIVDRFVYLKTGLAIVLVFVGTKMVAEPFVDIPTLASLGVIVTILGATVPLSIRAQRKKEPNDE